jgi:TolB protein
MRKIFILYFFCEFALAGAKEDPMVVQLSTNCRLLPLHLEEFEDAHSGFEAAYLKKLEEILSFDLNHNGMTYTPKKQTAKSKLPNDAAKYPKLCQELGVYYLVKTQVKDKTLAIRLFSANNQQVKGIEGIRLTGQLNSDRHQMHQVADVIHKELFGKPGIADTHILYTVKSKIPGKNAWNSEVWESDYDGQNPRQITKEGNYCLTPAYIPPSKGKMSGSFFYVSYKTGQPKIYICSLHDGISQRLSHLKGNQLMPAMSPLRDQVAFICDATGNPDLFIQPFKPEEGIKGKPRQLISSSFATQGSPVFSPDGQKIAFVSNKDGTPRIYLLDLAKWTKAEPLLLTKYTVESTAPAWSPDGTKIAYCTLTEGVRQIWMYDLTKNEEKQLTRGPGHKENPSWAPNSLHLVYNSSDAGAAELYLMNLNQTDGIKISSGEGEKRFPNWEPREIISKI